MSELHFASKFPDVFPLKDRIKEKIKCLAMNRQNIFFDRLSEPSLESIFREIMAKRPVLVHAHPSTIYALACYVERKYGPTQLFDIFESSGELLDENKRRVIEDNLKCSVIDRYGSAEFGVVAYQRRRTTKELQVLDTMFYPESLDDDKGAVKDVLPGELVVTSLKNTMMPLIRYRTGDRAKLTKREDGYYIDNLVGRIHDLVEIDGQLYPTHFLQDVLDRVGGVEEFQVATGSQSDDIILRIVAEQEADCELIEQRINGWWPSVKVVFISAEEIVHVGWRAKFRHFVSLDAV
jgi:phenylacetate-CoA ligase